MRFLTFFLIFSAFSLASADLMPAAGKNLFPARAQIDSVLVSVNGEPITLLDVILETAGGERELAGLYTGERLLTETRNLRRAALEKIILRKLVFLQYKEKPFPVPPQEIENILNSVARDLGDSTRATLEKKIVEMGSSMQKLRDRALEKIVTEVILAQFCDRAVFVTPQEVYEEYNAHPDEWTTPERLELQLLQLARDGGRAGPDVRASIEKLKKLLKDADGTAFVRLVKEYSDASAASDGGSTGFLERTRLRPEFADALKGKQPGAVIGPVETPEAFYFIRFAALEKEKKVPFSQISEVIYNRLYANAIRSHREEYSQKLRSRAIVRYYFQ